MNIRAMVLLAGLLGLPLCAGATLAAETGNPPLVEAARRGKFAMVRALPSGGADLNAREVNVGQNALMWAIVERPAAVTEELVRRGTDVHARSKRGFTALMFSAQQGDADAVR